MWRNFSDNLRRFFFQPASPYPLSFLRMGVALILLIQGIGLTDEFLEFYGQMGIIQGGITEYLLDPVPWSIRISTVASLLAPWGISHDQCAFLVFILYLISLVFVFLGWSTRFFSFLSYLSHLILMNSAPLTNYGADRFGHILLFYFIWMPVSRVLSLDSLFSFPKTSTPTDTICLRLIQFHLCLVYFQSGISKTAGFMWWNGEAIWRSVMAPEYRQFDFSFLAQFPWTALLAGFATLIIEIGYPLFIWPRKTRVLWTFLTLFLHLGIVVFQGLVTFGLIMMVLTGCSFGIPVLMEKKGGLVNIWTKGRFFKRVME